MSNIGHSYFIQNKKKVIIDWAEKLEGKIPLDTICMTLCQQLRGQVSDRFIRECLAEKYKQKHRVENAKRQPQKRYKPKH